MDENNQSQNSAGNQPEQPAQPSQWQYQSGNLVPQGNFAEPLQPDADQPKPRGAQSTQDSISWSASEFTQHEKSANWYVYLAVATVVLGVAIYFLTKEIFSVVVIAIMAIVFGVFAALRPRTVEYSISPAGIKIGPKRFMFEDFRSFAVVEEGALPSIQLLPLKRFAVAISMYFEPKDGDKIVEILGTYLPFEQRDRDLMDKLSSKIHF
jgi:hypothetical protein